VIRDSVFDFEPDLDDLPADERAAVLAAEAEEGLEELAAEETDEDPS